MNANLVDRMRAKLAAVAPGNRPRSAPNHRRPRAAGEHAPVAARTPPQAQGDHRQLRGFPIQIDAIVQRGKDIPFSQLDDELLAIDAQAGYCYSLNETAGRVWDLIATPISLEAICAQLRREYAVDEPTCRREVTTLLQGLCDAGLVQVAG